ncbi:MAG: phosphatase PAP2 family protein, partial [Alphaproteobacteria bacterium]|nr:phosphatase PAP2 family protein [Alphaproteobacteria bacterium]
MIEWITDLGDAALLLPASAVLFCYFLYRRAISGAFAWVSALLICAAATTVLKIAFNACGSAVPLLDIRSPSGHASLSTAFYLCAGIVAATDTRPSRRAATLLASVTLIAAIAASRIALHAHTPAEVAFGCVIGLCSAAWFLVNYARSRPAAVDWRPIVGAILAL